MALAGLRQLPKVVESSLLVKEAIDTTVELFNRLILVEDEQVLRASLLADYTKLTKLGEGRLYPELPATITFAQLLKLANILAAARGYPRVDLGNPYWSPGTERQSVTDAELNGSAKAYAARLAPFSRQKTGYDRLLHFLGLPFDEEYRERNELTQLEALEQAKVVFANEHPAAVLRAADQRDFVVWYIMDLLRDVPAKDLVLPRGFMRVPALGRRAVRGGSYVGDVFSRGGRARFGGSFGDADGDYGLGLSAGLVE